MAGDGGRRTCPFEIVRARAKRRPAITHPVLEARRHRHSGDPLQPTHLGGAERRDEGGVVGEALVRATPSHVVRHGDTRREDPIDPTRIRFLGGKCTELLDEGDVGTAVGVAHAPLADVVREERRALEVGLAVHRIVAV